MSPADSDSLHRLELKSVDYPTVSGLDKILQECHKMRDSTLSSEALKLLDDIEIKVDHLRQLLPAMRLDTCESQNGQSWPLPSPQE